MTNPDHIPPASQSPGPPEQPSVNLHPIHMPQEIALDDPESKYLFRSSAEKPLVATPAALELYGPETILACLCRLQVKARLHHGLDYLHVFSDASKPEPLWIMEDDAGGAITALLPSDN